MKKQILIINEPNYKEITEAMTSRAMEAIEAQGYEPIVASAPDFIELPVILRYYLKATELRILEERIAGYVVLGCNEFGVDDQALAPEKQVINRLEKMKLEFSLALGYGVFTPKDLPHGLEKSKSITTMAVDRCLQLLEIKQKLGL